MAVHAIRSSRHTFVGAVAVLGLCGLSTTSVLAQAAGSATPIVGEQPASSDLLTQARAALSRNALIESQSLLRRLVASDTNLSDADRASVAELVERVDRKIQAADASDLSLQRAELALNEGDLRLA